jgi:5-methylcytosine-specific restriction endonuclease McrA
MFLLKSLVRQLLASKRHKSEWQLRREQWEREAEIDREYLRNRPIPSTPRVVRPPQAVRTPEQIEADREAFLAQEAFFSRVRWESHLSESEVERLRRLPIRNQFPGWTEQLFRDQNGLCFYCDSPLVDRQIHKDHLMPLALWGPNEIKNIVLSCAACNLSKGSKHPVHFAQSSDRITRERRLDLEHKIRNSLSQIRMRFNDFQSD